jgi:hypothetical protein
VEALAHADFVSSVVQQAAHLRRVSRPEREASASARANVLRADAFGREYSSGRWLTPARQGMKSIAVSAIMDMKVSRQQLTAHNYAVPSGDFVRGAADLAQHLVAPNVIDIAPHQFPYEGAGMLVTALAKSRKCLW